ncbi:hypothetical protein ACQP1G_39665 [Nocardia sp. CA-107356]|uniref:hypothetical protein n=1 Tax=Nocardia sp. CA-107356 TaxID=3239972 RepID=UPI003D8E6616
MNNCADRGEWQVSGEHRTLGKSIAGTASAPRIDLSSLIGRALHETGDDAVKVRIGVK